MRETTSKQHSVSLRLFFVKNPCAIFLICSCFEGVTDSSGMPKSVLFRVLTSTKTRIFRSNAIISISPLNNRKFRARILYFLSSVASINLLISAHPSQEWIPSGGKFSCRSRLFYLCFYEKKREPVFPFLNKNSV